MGIKNLKEFIVFIAALASAADKSKEGGLGVEDLANFMPALMKAPAALEGLDEAKLEAKDIDQAELQELQAAVAAELDLTDDKVEILVEEALSVAILVYGIVKRVKDLKVEA